MTKKILVLESSSTVQAIITEKLAEKEIAEPVFAQNSLRFLWTLCSSSALPDALLINAKTQNQNGAETLRFLRTIQKFQKIPACLYALDDFPKGKLYEKLSDADFFVKIEKETIAQTVERLLSIQKKSEDSTFELSGALKSAIVEKLFSLENASLSIVSLSKKCLSLLAKLTSSPAVSLFVMDDTIPFAHYLCAPTFTNQEIHDFLSVCKDDFEKAFPSAKNAPIVPQNLGVDETLSLFRHNSIPLSAFEKTILSSADGTPFASINAVKEGGFSKDEQEILFFVSREIGFTIQNALQIEKKNLFEKRIRKAFSRFVPEQIIDELVEKADTTDKMAVGEKRNVAILFSDIRSFTNISEKNKPEVIVAFLNRYFTIMVNIIKKHGGTIDKFIGDAIMALFGAPVSYEDNARRAVAAACEMREALDSVPLEDLILPEGMTFNIGIGIHYGDVIVGSIGSQDKTDYSVIGDNVNLASRLEGLTKTYGAMVVVSDSVKNDIKGKSNDFVFRYLDNVKVKGKNLPVPIYAVDKSKNEFSLEYRDAYAKGLDLYKQGVWNLAREYFEKAKEAAPLDKATKLMISRCEAFIKNPPENWDGAITFTTK